MSTVEAEYVALSASCTQVLWMRTQLMDYGFHFNKIPMYCDSKSTIVISCNPVQHSRNKHIDVRYHLIKEQVENGNVELYFVRSEYQLANMFTKALSKERYGVWFFESERGGGGRGVKEKQQTSAYIAEKYTIMVSSPTVDEPVEATVNTPVSVASVIQEYVTPSVDDMMAEMEKKGSLDDTIYANVTGKPSGKKLNFHALLTPGGNGMVVVVPVEFIRAISEQFANTSYGLFLGSMDGFYAMLENGPRFIRNNLLILKKWHPDENLLKVDVSTIPFWVKLHGVPVTAFSEDGLSAIATKLGTPLMLDSYTCDMCMQSWGRSSYTRALIELRADVELKDNIVVVMPKITREGHYTYNNRVEYEWKPPRCASCKIFGHIHEECPKNTGAGRVSGWIMIVKMRLHQLIMIWLVLALEKVLGFDGKRLKLLLFTLQVDINNSPIFVCYPNLQGNPNIGTAMEYRKALLASLDVPGRWSDYLIPARQDSLHMLYLRLKDTIASKVQEIKKAQNIQRQRPSERGFLSQKRSRGGRELKEKNKVVATKDVVSSSMIDEPVVKEKQSSLVEGLSLFPPLPTQGSTLAGNTPSMSSYATPRVDAAMKAKSPLVVEETIVMECPVVITPGVGPNPTTSTQEANASAGNAPSNPSYATATGKPSGKKVNVYTLYTPGGNGIDVVVLVDSIRAISERFANIAYGFFLGKKVAYPVVANFV
ncbi:putative reverse transcriptase domain-containing protein [Tanacetum coccineum]|uniref:Reverse transcriptase domain-containing protein n=1 Tax=Tanacetum coccineum TaxID=301880 RepID=A0ABQ4Y7E1_9ASTR